MALSRKISPEICDRTPKFYGIALWNYQLKILRRHRKIVSVTKFLKVYHEIFHRKFRVGRKIILSVLNFLSLSRIFSMKNLWQSNFFLVHWNFSLKIMYQFQNIYWFHSMINNACSTLFKIFYQFAPKAPIFWHIKTYMYVHSFTLK